MYILLFKPKNIFPYLRKEGDEGQGSNNILFNLLHNTNRLK